METVKHTSTFTRFTPKQIEYLKQVESNKGSDYIVKCVNSHEKLVEALRGLIVHLEYREDYIVEDAKDHTNAYSVALQALKSAGEI